LLADDPLPPSPASASSVTIEPAQPGASGNRAGAATPQLTFRDGFRCLHVEVSLLAAASGLRPLLPTIPPPLQLPRAETARPHPRRFPSPMRPCFAPSHSDRSSLPNPTARSPSRRRR
jgi:hypothetical protein